MVVDIRNRIEAALKSHSLTYEIVEARRAELPTIVVKFRGENRESITILVYVDINDNSVDFFAPFVFGSENIEDENELEMKLQFGSIILLDHNEYWYQYHYFVNDFSHFHEDDIVELLKRIAANLDEVFGYNSNKKQNN